MIISRTPYRISFVGGATDLYNYYSLYGGAVISCAINKYIYVTASWREDKKIVVSYSQMDVTDDRNQINHEIVRNALKLVGIDQGIEIHIIGDITSVGTGLGGSGAVTVGVLNALHRIAGHNVTKIRLAEDACKLEIDIMGKHIGKQDQYACALGGLNKLTFNKDGTVDIKEFSDKITRFLSDKIRLVPVCCVDRINAEILLKKQSEFLDSNLQNMHTIKDQVVKFERSLEFKNLPQLVRHINEYWDIKKKLSPDVTNPGIDTIINRHRTPHCGVKLCGAGHSGYLLLLGDSKDAIPIKIDTMGTQIIY